MRPTTTRRLGTALACGGAALLASGCGLLPGQQAAPPRELTVYLTVPQAEAAASFTGRAFGCGDLLVPVRTVPSSEVDPADAALDFLFSEAQAEHGDPVLHNAVHGTASSLRPTGHRRDGGTEVFTFDGAVTAADDCAAQRIRAQLEETARAQSDADDVRLEVGGRALDQVLGLSPLSLGAEVKGGSAGASPTADGSPSSADGTGWVEATPSAESPSTAWTPAPASSTPAWQAPSETPTPTETAAWSEPSSSEAGDGSSAASTAWSASSSSADGVAGGVAPDPSPSGGPSLADVGSPTDVGSGAGTQPDGSGDSPSSDPTGPSPSGPSPEGLPLDPGPGDATATTAPLD